MMGLLSFSVGRRVQAEGRSPKAEARKKAEIRRPKAPFTEPGTWRLRWAKLTTRSSSSHVAAVVARTLPISAFGFGTAALLLCLLLPSCTQKSVSDLQCYPPAINLSGAQARQRIVVQASYADGATRDVTARARCWIGDPRLARFEKGAVLALADGKTELRVSCDGRTRAVPVTVLGAATQRPLSFKLDVMPVFTKAGCNQGSCHGTSRGKDGFHLSLFGFDPEGDYFRLTREQIGRRINLALPEESLVVRKGLGAVQHTGGVRFGTNSGLYKTLVAWLTAGAPNDPTNIAKLAGIDIFPKAAVLEGSNAVQRFIVRAHYSDGADRDVTPLAVFLSNNEGTARAGDDGAVTAGQRGEAFIQARFGEFNVGAQVIVIPKDLPYTWPDIAPHNYIDEAVFTKLKKLRLAPSAVCDDATFIRRAYLDLTGTLPTPEETRAFTEDRDNNKRSRLVDGRQCC